MKWYVAAFCTCAVFCTIAAVTELHRAEAPEPWIAIARWAGLGCAAFAVACLMIAVGCGAPRRSAE